METNHKQIEVELPERLIGKNNNKDKKTIFIDESIVNTIQYLWDNNIETLGSCSGENMGEKPELIIHAGTTKEEIENIKRLIKEVDNRDWQILQWQLINTNTNETYKSYLSKELNNICILIGCSGMDNKCPGNPNCTILNKIIKE